MSNQEVLSLRCSNQWFNQGRGFKGLDLSLAAEQVLSTLEASKLPDGSIKPIFKCLGRGFTFRTCGIGGKKPETALPIASGKAEDKDDRG
eukprot:7941204-Alexandrium_andersonii.AAC.1